VGLVPYLRLGRNPIYYLGDGAGLNANNSSLELSLGYLAGDANDPADGSALFNGPYSALAQVVIAERSSIT